MIDLRLLGPVEAAVDGRAIALGGPRQRALLALLALGRGRPVSADRLAEELWQGRPPRGAGNTLKSYVSRLRSALVGNVVVTSPSGYALPLEPDQLDVHRFERLLGEGLEALERGAAGVAAERLATALSLWRGPALVDVADGGALALEAQRLDELRLVCLEAWAEAELDLGRHATLVPELERLVVEEPLREGFWRQLVLALYRSGRQADALAAHREARDRLDELGLEPSDELRSLEGAILRQELEPVAPAGERHNLPAPTTSFIDRARELEELEGLLRGERLVTLTGLGGCGKTRLALEAARRQAGVWRDGVWLVDVTPLAEPALVVGTVVATLGLGERPGVPALESLLEQLRRSELLLVLDNCEHLAEACAELADEVLRGCPHVRLLATSRVALRVVGEAEYALDPLPIPSEAASRVEIERAPSVRLFLDRSRAVHRTLGATDEALATVARICRQLDGLPLAIELAAARAKALSLEEIAARLGDRFRFLRAWRRIADPRHQTLQATMDWSHQLLAEDERLLLRRVSVFAGGFTLAAAAAVCLDGDDERALDALGRLVDASLVRREDRSGETRYVLLETVRQYARQRLEEASELDRLNRAHALYFTALAEAAGLEEPAGGNEPLVRELGNVRAALGWASSADPELGLRLAAALEGLWVVCGPIEGMRWIGDLLERASDVPLRLRATALRAYGSTANPAGRDDLAERAYAESLEAFRALGDDRAAAVLLLRLGYSAFYRRHTAQARAFADESLAAFSASGNRRGESQSLSLLGEVEYAEGNSDRGLELMEAGADLAGEAGFDWWRASMLGKLADAALERGQPRRGAGYAREALAISHALGDRLRCVRGLARLAVVAAEGGDLDRAGTLWGAVEAEERRAPVGAWEGERERFARQVLGRDGSALERERERGRTLSLDEAISQALSAGDR